MKRLSSFSLSGLVLLFMACGGLTPEKVDVTDYSEVEKLLSDQYKKVGDKLEKKVMLGDKQEVKTFELDTNQWKTELSFLKEINPNQPEYVGAFTEEKKGDTTYLMLKPEESGSLKTFVFTKQGGNITGIEALIHEDKDVYIHHKQVTVRFEDEVVSSYQVEGYQKILLKDSVSFQIKGRIIN